MAINNLTITVIDGVRSSSNSSSSNSKQNKKTEESVDKDSSLYKVLNVGSEIKKKMKSSMTPAQYFSFEMGTKIAINTLKQTANYFISDIGRANGDSNYQAQINRTLEIVSDAASLGGGILAGAQMGSMFGPAGIAIGALAGGITSAINTGFKYAERERTYQHEMFKQQNSQAYQLSQAGYSIWSGRKPS